MIEVEMRHEEQIDVAQVHLVEKWQCLVPAHARVDPAVEHDSLALVPEDDAGPPDLLPSAERLDRQPDTEVGSRRRRWWPES